MHSPGSFSLLALRMWWPIVAASAVLGTAVGVVAAEGAPYSATAYVRVDTTANPIQSLQIVSTALQLLDSDPIYTRVVGDSRAALNELRARTTIGVRDAGEVLSITIVAPTPEQAEVETERFAAESLSYLQVRADEQFAAVTLLGQQALADGALPNPEAEEFRLQRVGTNLADGQDSAFRISLFWTRLGGVQTPVKLGLSTMLAGPVGAVVGALVGFVGALVLGVRRRRVRSVSDLAPIGPAIKAYDPQEQSDGLMRVAARCATLDRPLVAVLAFQGAEANLGHVRADLKRHLRSEERSWLEVDPDDLGRFSATGMPRAEGSQNGNGHQVASRVEDLSARSARGRLLAASDADVMLMSGIVDRAAINHAAARADVVVLVGRRRRTRFGELSAACAELADLAPVVIIGPQSVPGPGDGPVPTPAQRGPGGESPAMVAAGAAPASASARPTPWPRDAAPLAVQAPPPASHNGTAESAGSREPAG